MRLLVAGGRNYKISNAGLEYLDSLHTEYNFTALLNGMANGVDFSARAWARANDVKIEQYPALWDILDTPGAIVKTRKDGSKFNAKAGPDRNLKMVVELVLDFPTGHVVVYSGGAGTNDLYEIAKEYNLIIHDLRKMDHMVTLCK